MFACRGRLGDIKCRARSALLVFLLFIIITIDMAIIDCVITIVGTLTITTIITIIIMKCITDVVFFLCKLSFFHSVTDNKEYDAYLYYTKVDFNSLCRSVISE